MIETTAQLADNATHRVVLVDDHEFVLEGVKQRFENVDDLTVIAVAASVASAITLVREQQPEFAVVDFRLPDGNGADLISEIRKHSPATKCVIYTSVTLPDDLDHGADAVVIKELFEDKLIETIRAIRDGDTMGRNNGAS